LAVMFKDVLIPNTPVSARGAILFNDESAALMPMISYDVPVTNNANVYLGAGFTLCDGEGKLTPLGNKDAVVLTTGLKLSQNIVVYGDAKWELMLKGSADPVSTGRCSLSL